MWLFSQGSQVSPSSLTFTLSSTGNWCTSQGLTGGPGPCSASFCNDGLFSTMCHSGCTGVNTLTIQTSGPTKVDAIVIQNRQDGYQQRLNGATVAAYLYNNSLWSSTVPSNPALSYTFQIGEINLLAWLDLA